MTIIFVDRSIIQRTGKNFFAPIRTILETRSPQEIFRKTTQDCSLPNRACDAPHRYRLSLERDLAAA